MQELWLFSFSVLYKLRKKKKIKFIVDCCLVNSDQVCISRRIIHSCVNMLSAHQHGCP